MAFRSINPRLRGKLALLFILPWLACLVLVAYFLKKSQTDLSTLFITIVILFLILYPVLAAIFLRRLLRSVQIIEDAASGLSFGKSDFQGSATVMPEFNTIIRSIEDVMRDVKEKTIFTDNLKTGKLDVAYQPRHDEDNLGRGLLNIQQRLLSIRQEDQQRNWSAEGLAKFVQVLQTAKDLKELSKNIILNLVKIVEANQGAIYLVTEQNNVEVLEMQACYAFSRSKQFSQEIFPGDGLIGQAFLEKDTVYLKDVPENFIRITSGLGESNPRHVLIVPLKINGDVVGIVELASFKPFSPHVIEFVEKIGESIAHTVSSFQVAQNTRLMLEESRAQAEEMRAQEEELRQNQEELQATQEAISRKYDALFKKLGELNYQSRFEQLKSITSTKKRNIEYYFDIIRNQIISFSEDTMIVEAIKAFKNTFYNVGSDTTPEQYDVMRERVWSYYEKEFIPKLNDHVGMDLSIDNYLPTEKRTVIFQDLYIASNPHPTGSKSLLDMAKDGSDYGGVHATYHPILRNYLEKFGYYDIFLIDVSTGDMLYSVFKEVDFATNLLNGEYGNTNFGRVVQNAMESSDRKFVQLIDFAPYDPSYHAPASFIATAVYDGDEKIGIVVFQMPIQKINQILTGNNSWREDGLGNTGETFIVGSDYKLRSVTREIIEDLEGHVATMKKKNYSASVIQQVRKMHTNILMEEIRMDAVKSGLLGKSGTSLEKNDNGQEVLTAYAPLNIADVKWMILSSMHEVEASSKITNLRDENI
jgi:hypothetical protein